MRREGRNLNIRISDKLLKQIAAMAKIWGVGKSVYVRKAILERISRDMQLIQMPKDN
jgi:predicted DNA-binding protein